MPPDYCQFELPPPQPDFAVRHAAGPPAGFLSPAADVAG